MAEIEQNVKLAYLTYDDMLKKLEIGEIDQYDVIFSKDKLVTYLISENLEPIEFRSKIYVFSSIEEAEEKLNVATDTYDGQVVSILYKDKFRGYIVNTVDDKFTVAPLWEHPDKIDYDTLGNRPIVNIEGTLDNPIVVSELDGGIYNIKGQYKISNLIETIYLSVSSVIVMVEKDGDAIHVKHITTDQITDFFISSDSVYSREYVTDQYLKDNNYATTGYVDSKIAALEQSIKDDIQQYISDIIDEQFNTGLDEKISSKIDEKIKPMDNSQVQKLFT